MTSRYRNDFEHALHDGDGTTQQDPDRYVEDSLTEPDGEHDPVIKAIAERERDRGLAFVERASEQMCESLGLDVWAVLKFPRADADYAHARARALEVQARIAIDTGVVSADSFTRLTATGIDAKIYYPREN